LLVNRQVDFHTNQSMERLMEDILKNPPSDGLAQVIPDTTTINMLKLDRLDWSVKVDFSEDLLRDMNVGSSFETEILKSIVNTLGRFYDVERVFISVDGKPYESGHYMLEADEFFEVDMDGIEEYQE
ncbi:MAG: GerMN domain-containing protein, partial [Tissierellaceae bacterium]